MIKKYLKWIPGSLFIALFILSIILVQIGMGRARQVLFFPMDNGKSTDAEIRLIPRIRDREERILETVKELLLGPSELKLNNILPAGTKIRTVILREKTLYLDFSEHFIYDSRGMTLPYGERIELLKRNLMFNYPFLDNISITVNGQIPDSSFYRIEHSFNNDNS